MQQYPNNAYIRSNFHRLRKEYNKSLKLARQKFVNDLVAKLDTLHENNPKLFWETIDKLKNNTVKTNPISISDWHKYMKDLYAADKHENPNFIPTAQDFSDTGPLDFPFTCGEVRKGIHKLKNNKQPGIDLIPNEFIKYEVVTTKDTQTGLVHSDLLSIPVSLEAATRQNILNLMDKDVSDRQLSQVTFLSMGSDNASVMTGRQKGLYAYVKGKQSS
ncbi:unnamed protein product [Mytilus edulis]|uniref:Uncharacterized protein n=1 Tax=Mytilus edulis TaxID=6550 RepID=A0A8S3Q8W7_MYTED|nr:unnamed protein product [Mytilus edulis]